MKLMTIITLLLVVWGIAGPMIMYERGKSKGVRWCTARVLGARRSPIIIEDYDEPTPTPQRRTYKDYTPTNFMGKELLFGSTTGDE